MADLSKMARAPIIPFGRLYDKILGVSGPSAIVAARFCAMQAHQ
jgi:hypothetical protein